METLAPRARLKIAHFGLSLSIATALSVVAWAWGNLSWKATGSSLNARAVALAVLVMVTALCEWGIRHKPSKKLGRFAIFVAFCLPTCAGCLTGLSDFNPGGGTNYMFASDTPQNSSAGLDALLLGGTLIGLSALWPLRRAARASSGEQAPGLLMLSGAWLLAALGVIAWLCLSAPLHASRWLLPYVGLAVFLILLGAAFRTPKMAAALALLGAGVGAGIIWLAVVWAGSTEALCERLSDGLTIEWQTSAVSAYRANGVQLEQLTCKMTLQYLNEKTRIVYGITPDGHKLYGAPLFARVGGSPLERADAARDLLFVDDCDQLTVPGRDPVPVEPLAGPIQAPAEQHGKLVFYGLHHNYVYGRGTSVGMMPELTRYEVDLRTFQTSIERLQ